MSLNALNALSPLDGRYRSRTEVLSPFFSEFALIRYRVQIEVDWLTTLSACKDIAEIQPFSVETLDQLQELVSSFSESDAAQIKAIEIRTNHDVKAMEYWLREKLADNPEIVRASEFIHFACTSEDINNLCHGMMLTHARDQVLLPAMDSIIERLNALSLKHADLAMLARTHGQTATPTTLGKEMANVSRRLSKARLKLSALTMPGKMNGAVGNYNAHLAAYPELDWEALCTTFVADHGLEFNAYTTQIEPHDGIAEWMDAYARINTVLIDLDRDIWGYISLGYFRQRPKAGEVGSSTMPHKVNPIDFENSEGNLGLSNAVLRHLAEKLPISRWQRDLTDSTVLRNLGVGLGYALLGYDSCVRGLDKLEADPIRIHADLSQAWEVLAEPIQTIMRKYCLDNPYDRLKALTRGKAVDEAMLKEFLATLPIPEYERERLSNMTPESYIGLASVLAKRLA